MLAGCVYVRMEFLKLPVHRGKMLEFRTGQAHLFS